MEAAMNLTVNSKAARLVGALDQLAKVQEAFEAGEVEYPALRDAFDAVAEAKAETGLEWKLELVA
jgi:hypothetical protein